MLLFTKTYKTRYVTVTQNKMDWDKTWEDGTFVGSMQFPKGALDFTNRDGGSYVDGSVVVYSNTRLETRDEDHPETQGTFVLFSVDNGKETWFEVVKELTFQVGSVFSVIDHYKYIAEPRNLKEAGL